MKFTSESLGGLIAILAAIALILTIVTGLTSPIGDFFLSIASRPRPIADKVLDFVTVFDVQLDSSGPQLIFDQVLSEDSAAPTVTANSVLLLSGKVTNCSSAVSLTVNGSAVSIREDGTWNIHIDLALDSPQEIQLVVTDGLNLTITKTFYVVYCI